MFNRKISLILVLAVLFGLTEVCFAAQDPDISVEGNGSAVRPLGQKCDYNIYRPIRSRCRWPP
jgi:hypothetical protein